MLATMCLTMACVLSHPHPVGPPTITAKDNIWIMRTQNNHGTWCFDAPVYATRQECIAARDKYNKNAPANFQGRCDRYTDKSPMCVDSIAPERLNPDLTDNPNHNGDYYQLMAGPTPSARLTHACCWFFTLSECTAHARSAKGRGYWACVRMSSQDGKLFKIESRGLN
jgi:hypothetical protein